MTWINIANTWINDLRRVWYLDSTESRQALFDGPVAGTVAYHLSNVGYGWTSWQESSQYGIAVESAAYKGDWTYEGFIYITGAASNALFNAGGWASGSTEALNLTALVYVNSSLKLAARWETGANVTVTPSATSTTAMSLNTWYHVAVVKDATAKTLTYYINGALAGTATFTANPTGGDSPNSGDCRTAFGGYVGGFTLPAWRCACATFSTTTRDAAWMAASYSHLFTDAALPIDENTWMNVGPFMRSNIERSGVVAVDAAHATAYEDGYDDGYTAGAASTPPADATRPVITILDPAPGTTIGGSTVLRFRYTDDVAMRRPIPMIKFEQRDRLGNLLHWHYEVIHDGEDFTPDYSGERTVIAGGYEFTVRRRSGWGTTLAHQGGSPILVPLGYDTTGNEPL